MAPPMYCMILTDKIIVCVQYLESFGFNFLSLIALEAHPDLSLSQAQVEAPLRFQEGLFLALGHGSPELLGLGQPVKHPFAD